MSWTLYQSVNYEQGAEGGRMQVSLICDNLPLHAVVGFFCSTSGPDPVIFCIDQEVSTYPKYSVGMFTNIPANFKGDIMYYVTVPEGTSIPPNAKMEISVSFSVPN